MDPGRNSSVSRPNEGLVLGATGDNWMHIQYEFKKLAENSNEIDLIGSIPIEYLLRFPILTAPGTAGIVHSFILGH
jgi:hypothetical protein